MYGVAHSQIPACNYQLSEMLQAPQEVGELQFIHPGKKDQQGSQRHESGL